MRNESDGHNDSHDSSIYVRQTTTEPARWYISGQRDTAGSPVQRDIPHSMVREMQELFDLTNDEEDSPVIPVEQFRHAMPIVGLRVMINPEHNQHYIPIYHGKSGNITSIEGNEEDSVYIIEQMRKRGYYNENWIVKVMFDGLNEESYTLQHLLPIEGGEKDLYVAVFGSGIMIKRLDRTEYDIMKDEYVILQGKTLKREYFYDQEYRQKLLNLAQ